MDEACCQIEIYDLIDIAEVADVHEVLPTVVLFENSKHLVLPDVLSQPGRTTLLGYAEKQSVVIELKSE